MAITLDRMQILQCRLSHCIPHRMIYNTMILFKCTKVFAISASSGDACITPLVHHLWRSTHTPSNASAVSSGQVVSLSGFPWIPFAPEHQNCPADSEPESVSSSALLLPGTNPRRLGPEQGQNFTSAQACYDRHQPGGGGGAGTLFPVALLIPKVVCLSGYYARW